MRNILLLLCTVLCIQLQAQQQMQKWNRQMQLKNCTIDIKCGAFTATTFIEMEFYNPYEQELEGLHQFILKPGQVITAFQLELNGKYRDGTLEEKWKATNAYNRIVGKRIDPALLSMDYKDHYSLRIYPVPPKGSRKITFTIQQLLTVENGNLQYFLPVNVPDTVKGFHLSIQSTAKESFPISHTGIIEGKQFSYSGEQYILKYEAENIPLKSAIGFFIPLLNKTVLCTKTTANQKYFAVRFQPTVAKSVKINPTQLTVFWDASASAENRNINTEIGFLEQFISWHHIKKITIIPFNYKLLDTAVFYFNDGSNNKWKHYLRSLMYDGSTQLGCINIKNNNPDLCMLFTDGKNTYGNKKPIINGSLLYCINSSCNADFESMKMMAGATGGKVVDLNTITISKAIDMCSTSENWLLNITSSSGKIISDQSFPIGIDQSILMNGTMQNDADTLFFHYGNNAAETGIQQIIIPAKGNCSDTLIDRITMLKQFDKIISSYDWEKVLDVGLEENIVTPNTAYIVLERIEDYIKYNIEAPKDLQEECKLLQYVKSSTRINRQNLKKQDEFNIVNDVVNVYNERIKTPGKDVATIKLNRDEFEQINKHENSNANVQQDMVDGNSNAIKMLGAGTSNLDEVVVIGYSAIRKSNMTGSVTYIRSKELTHALSVEQALQGRVPGLMVTQQTGTPGAASGIMLRGQATLSGNREPLYVLDGMPVSGNINDLINVNNIQEISVLQGVQATAIYGSMASNGVVIINSKKWRYNNYYYSNKRHRLKDMEDEDYIQEIQGTPVKEKLIIYNKLKEAHASETVFYFDMAQHFYQNGLENEAFEILMNAAEVANGAVQVQQAIGYILESWKMFNEAINIYKQIAMDNNQQMQYQQDLAWAHYQQGNYQLAVDIFYAAIKMNTGSQEQKNVQIKAIMLYEMNEIIFAHKTVLDISMIPAALIKSSLSALRIVLDCNEGNIARMMVTEPTKKLLSNEKTTPANGEIIYGNSNWNYNHAGPLVYEAAVAKNGNYKICINYYGSYYQANFNPSIIRIKTFKNFGKRNQHIEIENVIMNNQYGEIEIGEQEYNNVKNN